MRSCQLVFIFFISLIISTTSFAATYPTEGVLIKDVDSEETDVYWTTERMRNARPMPMPKADARWIKQSPTLENPTEKSQAVSEDGAAPQVTIKPDLKQLFKPKPLAVSMKKAITAFDRGSFNADFSSSRLVPLTADMSYPYTTVGKLFFTIPGSGDFVCSASVIRQRVVLTAGHCVHKGSGGTAGFYTNWLFVPAFRDGAAPFQSWSATLAGVTSTWATGGGGVPNAADYAMLELQDRVFSGTLRRIGTVTGYLGYQTLSLIPNHSHLLGYPCNFDSCQKMHQVTAQSSQAVAPNTAIYGSDMRGGSSGGPWVQNFGAYAVGQTGGTNAGLNRVVGITSYGYVSTAPLVQGSSIPDSRFINLLNTICAHQTGNCS